MELKLDICTVENCKVFVKDVTETSQSSGYIPEDASALSLNRFKYSDTASVEVIYMERYNSDRSKIDSTKMYAHTEENRKNGFELPISFDGVFTIYSLVLPTREWFSRMIVEAPDLVAMYNHIYMVDVDANVIYKAYMNPARTAVNPIDNYTIEGVDAEEVIEINPEGTTISRTCNTYASVCHLLHCYLSLCQAIFESHGFSGSNSNPSCFGKGKVDEETIYRRDMVWMALNVIRYLVEEERLQEAQRIIEQIGGCNGLCNGWYEHSSKGNGCGCGQSSNYRKSNCGCR